MLASVKLRHARRATQLARPEICFSAKGHVFIDGFFGDLAAMCKAELNSGDQTAELLSLGQNSTSATSECGVQSLLLKPEVVFLTCR